MNCIACKSPPAAGDQDCLELAIQTIRTHYMYFKRTCNENALELEVLRERNTKLMQAVEMLQQKEAKSRATSCGQTSGSQTGIFNKSVDYIEIPATESIHDNDCSAVGLPLKSSSHFCKTVKTKQERADGLKHRSDKDLGNDELSAAAKRRKLTLDSIEIFSTEYVDCSLIDDDSSASKLNMALNSEQLLNTTNESVTSIKVLNDDNIGSMKNLRESRKIDDSHKATENRSALANFAEEDDIKDSKKFKWMSKTNSSHRALQSVGNNVSSVGFKKKKTSLSLSRRGGNVKLKQTRLHLDFSREKSLSASDTTYCEEEAVVASPNRDGSLTKSKGARSGILLLRTGSSIANASTKKLQPQSVTKTAHNAEGDKQRDIFKYPKTNEEAESPGSHVDLLDEFELRPEDDISELPYKRKPVAAIANATAMAPPDVFDALSHDTSSVMMMTQATPDVIFVDDTHPSMATLDWRNVLAGTDHCMHLKRLECGKISTLQQDATKPDAKATATTSNPIERQENPDHKYIFDTINREQDYSRNTLLEMRQGANVKQEQKGTKTGLEVERGAQEKRFNVCCEDCQKLIYFIGAGISDEAVCNLMSKCRCWKKTEALKNATPEGFWNPLMASYDINDPRNEVLLDTRFADKKDTDRYGDTKI